MVRISTFLAALGAVSVFAHPGEEHSHEQLLSERAELEMHASHIQRGLNACAQNPKFLALKARGQARRAEKARLVRAKRGLTAPLEHRRRDTAQLETYAALSHNSSTSGYTIDTDPTTLFASNKNASCVLTPKVTEGPFYVTGEYYRSNVTDGQAGVPLHLEYQYIDISTCDVAEGLYIEHWHANSTGVYSGVEASGNGAGTADPSNLNNTFLRGIQSTDSDGVAAFDTVFPGHYAGRAVHIHMMAHQNGTILSNGTFIGAAISSVGQVFFDQGLIADVSTTEPYASNTQSLVLNADDSIAASEADGIDPFAEYAYLGEDISDGLLGWINVGIDLTATYNVSPGAYFYSTGGVEGGSFGGSGSGGAPSGGAPSGGMPSGAMPSGSGAAGPVPTTGSPSVPVSVSGTASGTASAASPARSSGTASAASSVRSSSTASASAAAFTSSASSNRKTNLASSIKTTLASLIKAYGRSSRHKAT